MGKFIDELGNIGFGVATNAANGLVGGLLGQAFAGANDRRQLRQQEKLQALEMRGSKEMTDYNYGKQMQMWKDTNYSAQMAELSKAGLNPGLLYGMGGGGGATTGSGAGASVGGGKAAAVAGENVQMADRMMQLGLMGAQKKNIEADTANKLAQAAKTGGVDTALVNKQIESLTQGIQNQRAVEKLTNLQSEVESVKASVSRQTINEQMKSWELLISKGEEELKALKLNNDLSKQQLKDKVLLLKRQVAGEAIKNALMHAEKSNVDQDTKLKVQQIRESERRVVSMVTGMMLEWDKYELDRRRYDINEDNWRDSQGKRDWDFLKELVPDIMVPIGRGMGAGSKPVGGFHKR